VLSTFIRRDFRGHISGENRYQTKIMCLDEYIDKDSIVRVIDRFADTLDLGELGFKNKEACKDCPSREACLNSKTKFRTIIRRPQNDILDRSDARYKENIGRYKLRQQIAEHVFGTVKRTMNGGYYLLRSKEKVKAETAMLFLCYNIKRTRKVLGTERMMELMDEWGTICREGTNALLTSFIFAVCRLRYSMAIPDVMNAV
jgi:hypothetical protein